jgi:hypothetical protein
MGWWRCWAWAGAALALAWLIEADSSSVKAWTAAPEPEVGSRAKGVAGAAGVGGGGGSGLAGGGTGNGTGGHDLGGRVPFGRLVQVNQVSLVAISRRVKRGKRGKVQFQLRDDSIMVCLLSKSSVLAPRLAAKVPSLMVLAGSCDGGGSASLTIDSSHPRTFSATLVPSRARPSEVEFVDAVPGLDVFRQYKKDEAFGAEALAGKNRDGGGGGGGGGGGSSSSSSSSAARASIRSFSSGHSHDAASSTNEAVPEFRCGTPSTSAVPLEPGIDSLASTHALGDARGSSLGRSLLELDAAPGVYVLRLALMTSRKYSAYHGDTIASVVAALATLLTRVNGIFLRELGVMFQLIADNDKLICLSGSSWCDGMPNDGALLKNASTYMGMAGVSESTFDLGHSLTTAGGGLAVVGSLCLAGSKWKGQTGISKPENDPFLVDYVTHEISHQMGGHHSFRNCTGSADPNVDSSNAIEPGSGSTIMGYAGICSAQNLQAHSDPYYDALSLFRMRALVERLGPAGCGTRHDIGLRRPLLSAPGACTVPMGSYVALNGWGTTPSPLFYSWDVIDSAPASYVDSSVPRFRSWQPTARGSRFLPNMHQLSFQYASLAEIEPKASTTTSGSGAQQVPGADLSMVFRLTGRTTYQEQGASELSEAGTFGFTDLVLTYSAALPALRLLHAGPLQGGKDVSVAWSGLGPAAPPRVELLVALVTMEPAKSLEGGALLDYERDVHDLEWVSLGSVHNNGSATLPVPAGLENPRGLRANLMIRPADADPGCYPFHLLPDRTFVAARVGGGPSDAPTTRTPTTSYPTLHPTTKAPTWSKTAPPSWTCAPSYYNANDGCDCGCGAVDPDCFGSQAALYCGGGESNTTGLTCDLGTSECVAVPLTGSPSQQPSAWPTVSARPSARPTREPTLQPSARPTRQPSARPSARPSAAPTPFSPRSGPLVSCGARVSVAVQNTAGRGPGDPLLAALLSYITVGPSQDEAQVAVFELTPAGARTVLPASTSLAEALLANTSVAAPKTPTASPTLAALWKVPAMASWAVQQPAARDFVVLVTEDGTDSVARSRACKARPSDSPATICVQRRGKARGAPATCLCDAMWLLENEAEDLERVARGVATQICAALPGPDPCAALNDKGTPVARLVKQCLAVKRDFRGFSQAMLPDAQEAKPQLRPACAWLGARCELRAPATHVAWGDPNRRRS